MSFIKVRGAQVHNLKNIDIDIPMNRITCISGPSGSGKSSLAFHTLYNESKRRYLNSMPDSLKFFSDRPLRANVDEVSPVLPAFALAQLNPVMTSRSCVMDVVGLLEKLQKFFYFLGDQYCPLHHRSYENLMPSAQIGLAFHQKKLKKSDTVHLLIPRKDYEDIYGNNVFPARSLRSKENKINIFSPALTEGENDDFYELFRFKYANMSSLDKKHEEFLKLKEAQELILYSEEFKRPLSLRYSKKKSCPLCGKVPLIKCLEHYSPYNALGACQNCSGHGAILVYDEEKIFPNLNLSMAQGATALFNYKRIAAFKKNFIKEIKEHGFSEKIPLKKFNKKTWQAIRHGGTHFQGLDGIFQYLESKRYKKDVRILLRNLQKEEKCQVCEGTRVLEDARYTRIVGTPQGLHVSFGELLHGSLNDLARTLIHIVEGVRIDNSHVASLLKSMISSLRVAIRIGLGNLPLLKKSKHLTPGEYQRLLMVKYLSYEGSGSLFIFDEPSLGLSQKEQQKLFNEVIKLRDQGNTILIVEHANLFYELSDEVIEMGQGAGLEGGEVVYQGASRPIERGRQVSGFRKKRPSSWIVIHDLEYELYQKDKIQVPFHCLTQVKGDSSSGKVQLMVKALPDIIRNHIHGIYRKKTPYSYGSLVIENELQDVYCMDPHFGKVTGRSTVGSFLGISPEVRKYYACLPYSKVLDLKPGHFSSNSPLGKCPACEGRGAKMIDMVYLEDIHISCEDCQGMGLKPKYAHISDGQLTSYEAFSFPMKRVIGRLKLTPKYHRIWQYVQLLNLDYLSLFRTLNSLSGGERQRINLLAYLTKNIQNSLLIFENLSFGLSEKELVKLALLLRQICDRSNSIIIVDDHDIFHQVSDYSIDFNRL